MSMGVSAGVEGMIKDVGKGLRNHYQSVSPEAKELVKDWVDGGGGAFENGLAGKTSSMGKWMWNNLEQSAYDDGRSVLGMVGSHALKGAAWGAVGGGTISALQGGSFWDGAKQGAFNGAVGIGGLRTLKRATGAESYLFGKQSILRSGGNMWGSMNKNPEISKQAAAILNNRQTEGLARWVMKGN